ncbi:MAG: phosphatidate cytidylyltransferase [Actinomycetota bacterium]|nr:phosphatidate cytidylyltransferase [Actinomycetota bacterium]
MSDREERDQPEGVRILGAEEAQAALEGEVRRVPDSTWSASEQGEIPLADVEEQADRAVLARPVQPEEPEDLVRPVPVERPVDLTVDLSDDELPPEAVESVEPVEAAEAPALQHWTEPATGQLPAVFAGTDDEDEDFSAWASFGGPTRFRSEGSDWSEAAFDELGEIGGEESTKIGALADAPPPDDDEAFAAQVAARRRRGGSRPRVQLEPDADEADMLPVLSGRDLPMALLTAAAIVVVALLALAYGRVPTLVLSAVIVGLSCLELANALRLRGHHPATLIALLGSVGLVFAAERDGTAAFPLFFALTAVFSLLWFLWKVTPGRPVRGVASTLLTFGYVGVLGAFAGLLLQSRDGVGLVLGTAICTVAYDVIGYFFGSQFGRSRIAPEVSPNKTVEGTLVGWTAAVVLGYLLVGQIAPWDHKSGLALGFLVGTGSILGDLCESMIKRDLDLKDFGSFLPGHGGVLDRFDGLLFCLPITYYLALHLKLF